MKVFVLGDSRTGTTSLHRLLLDYGFDSVHYYVDEVNEIAQRHGCDGHEYRHVSDFIRSGRFNAFTDYPTRTYFRQLRREFPNSYFILSTRKDLTTWKGSMRRFFCDRPDVLSNLRNLGEAYEKLNDQVRYEYLDAPHFMEMCIDDDNDLNSEAVANFLGRDQAIPLRTFNATT